MVNQFFDLIKVYDTEYTKVRVGGKGDGGYIVAKELAEKVDCVYSFGIGDDISFEEDFCSKFNPQKVKCFDHTINGIDTDIDKLQFYQRGLDSETRSLSNLIIVKNNLLKIDIEGNEWDYFYNYTSELMQFDQLLIELHIIGIEDKLNLSPYFTGFYKDAYRKINENLFEVYYQALSNILISHSIIHVHGNNSLPKTRIGNYEFPPLLELTLVRNDLIKEKQLTQETFPVDGLDFPNKTDRTDFDFILPFNE